MAKLPCPPRSRIYTLKDTGETMSYDQVREYLMSNPELWQEGATGAKEGPLSSVEATAKALEGVDVQSVPLIDNALFKLSEQELSDLYDADPDNLTEAQYEQQKELKRLAQKPSLQVLPDIDAYFAQTPKSKRTKNGDVIFGAKRKSISEAYHAAKKDGSNPELVKAVEDLLGEKAEGKEAAPAPSKATGAATEGKGKPSTIDKLIESAEQALKELKSDSTIGANKPLGELFLQTYIAILKAAKAAGETITSAQARIRARKQLIAQGYDPAEVDKAKMIASSLLKEQAPPPPPPPKPETEREEGPQMKERKFVTSVKNSADISDEVKEAFSEDAINYQVLPNDVSVAEANAILEAVGVDKAAEMVMGNNTMPSAFRFTLAQILIKKYNEQNRFSEATNLVEQLSIMATDFGQGIQALSLLRFLTPEGQLLFAQRTINKMREKKFKEHKPRIEKIKKAVDGANKEAAKEAAERAKGRFPQGVPSPKPKEYGASNTIFKKADLAAKRKALKGKVFSVAGGTPPELLWIAGYHIEAGARSFADFSKEMIKEVGKKVKPYLKQIYKEAQKQVGGTGYSTDTEIAEYLAKDIDKDILKAAKELDLKISDLIVKHYSETDVAKKKLADKLVEELGIDPADAAVIQKAVDVEFGKIIKEKQKKALDKVLNPVVRKTRKVKRLEEKLIELSNLGGFDMNALKDAYAKAFEFPELTNENAAKIKELAEKVQKTKEGIYKQQATEELLKYQANLKGWSWADAGLSVWMASILSGPATQIVNITSNALNALSLFSIAAIRNPRATVGMLDAMRIGLGRGLFEAMNVIYSGYSPIKDKAQIPDILERKIFFGKEYNPFNYYKYVRRIMIAADVLTFEPLQEMRAYQVAYQKTGSRKGAIDLMNYGSDKVELAKEEAADEYNEIVANIDARTDLTNYQKSIKKDIAKIDRARRVYEILSQKRPIELMEEAHAFAERGTFNRAPSGLLGFIAKKVNETTQKVPLLRFVVPFTNVVTNVANETLNYSPVGLARAFTEKGTITGLREDTGITENDKKDLMVKAAIGTTATILVYALSGMKDDEDDEPLLEITADGYGDFPKNKELEESGWQPYSIKMKGRWYSYKYSMLRPLFASVGMLRDSEKYGNKKIDETVLNKWSLFFGGLLQETLKAAGFVESANTFVNAIMNERNTDKMLDKLISWLSSTASSFVPVIGTNFYQQIANTFRERLNIPDKEYYGTYFGKIARNIPVARDKYNNKVNGLGEELPGRSTSIVYSDLPEGPYVKLWQLLAKNGQNTGLQNIKTATLIKDEKEVPMTETEYYNYAKYRGEFLRETLEDNYEYLYGLSKDEFEKELNNIKTIATTLGKVRVQNPDIKTYKEYKKILREQMKEETKEDNPSPLKPNKILKKYFSE